MQESIKTTPEPVRPIKRSILVFKLSIKNKEIILNNKVEKIDVNNMYVCISLNI
jgi:hypothetical protein